MLKKNYLKYFNRFAFPSFYIYNIINIKKKNRIQIVLNTAFFNHKNKRGGTLSHQEIYIYQILRQLRAA